MLVRAKTRDIAILRTMGASRRGMMKVFMTVGVTIGTLGIVLGIVLGALFLRFRQDVVDDTSALTGANLWGSFGANADRAALQRPIHSRSPSLF